MEKKETIYSLLGCLPKAITANFIAGAVALVLGVFLGGPKIYIDLWEAILTFCFLIAIYAFITGQSLWALYKYKAHENLVVDGPYKFVRSPMYAAVIFILNPALGILFRSWLLFLASIPIYFIWKKCILKEETHLGEKFGQAYVDYKFRVGRFFPRIWESQKLFFYPALAVLIFGITFVSLNYEAFYLRWVSWETKGEIVYDQTSKKAGFFSNPSSQITLPSPASQNETISRAANYNSSSNSIYIQKIGITAPIIQAEGTGQAQLNAALDLGVVLYPGSPLPGSEGEVALTGHSSVYAWNKTPYGQIFALLDKVEKGDIVSIVYNNYQYDYAVVDKKILLANQVKTTATLEQKLMISTCWPIGTSLKRLVVYAELIK